MPEAGVGNNSDDQYRVTNCERCSRLCESRSRIVNGVGDVNAEVVFVGEAPGQSEDETGEPFVGQSGSVLDDSLNDAGLSREDVYITNAVRCRPPENKDPYVEERDNCIDHLAEDIHTVNPDVVVPLGRIPTKQLLPDAGKVTDIAGKSYSGQLNNWSGTIIPSVHPAATLYDSSLRPVFKQTMQTVSKSFDSS